MNKKCEEFPFTIFEPNIESKLKLLICPNVIIVLNESSKGSTKMQGSFSTFWKFFTGKTKNLNFIL